MSKGIEDFKARIKKSIEDYSRSRNKTNVPTRKNKSPEEKVAESFLKFFRDNGFYMNRYESKAKRIKTTSGKVVWRASGLIVGHPDFLGCDKNGVLIACEIKAPGRRVYSNCSEEQLKFLRDIICKNGFGCIVDSVDHFEKLYYAWSCKEDKSTKQQLLISDLPRDLRAINDLDWDKELSEEADVFD